MTNNFQDLVITRLFEAPVEEVWRAWSESGYVKLWWGPIGFTCSLAKMDFREGGTSLVSMSSPDFGVHYSIWHYKEIVSLQRIAYIHNLADENGNKLDPVKLGMPPDFPQDQLHTVTFRAVNDNKTEMTVTEYGWTVGQMMEMSKMGLNQCLDKMAAIFAKNG